MFSQPGQRGWVGRPTAGFRSGQRTSDSISSANVKFLLFDQPFPQGKGLPLTAYSEASFVGYAQVLVNPLTAGAWPPGTGIEIGDALCTNAVFTAGALVGPVTIYGYGVVDDTSLVHELLVAVPFAEPITLTAMGDAITLVNPHWQAEFNMYCEAVTKMP
jgi:hypothetical protein